MKERIEQMRSLIASGRKVSGADYQKLLEDFIQEYDGQLFPAMYELIKLPKNFKR